MTIDDSRFREHPDKPAGKAERTGLFERFLTTEGFRPRLDQDGDIIFKFEGLNLLISFDEGDEDYFRVACPNIWTIEGDDERVAVQQAALDVTREIKLAKVVVLPDDVWVAVEAVCSPIQSGLDILLRCIHLTGLATRRFQELMCPTP